jgi:autotransporter adhesin
MFQVNTIDEMARVASADTWAALSERGRERSKMKCACAAGLAVVMTMASAGVNVAFAASTGNGAIQLCEGVPKGTNGYAVGYGSAGTTTGRCGDGSEVSFTMYNNADGSDGVNGWSGAGARITGYKDGTLELRSKKGLLLQGSVSFDSDASMQSHKITNLADGSLSGTSKDAVTGAQLYATNQNVSANAGNISTLQQQIKSGAIGLVLQDGAGQDITLASGLDGDAVDFTGKKAGVSQSRRLTGVTDGVLSSTSKDAVTGAQLYATNKNVSANANNIAALQSQISGGSFGLVKQDATTQAITVADATGGGSVSIAGTDGVRVLSGVANGTADSDAVTIAQLKAAGLVNPDGKPMLALVYDDLAMSGATLGGTGGTVLRNLGEGAIAKGSMEAINGGQLFDFQKDVQNRMSALGGKVDALNQQVSQIQQTVDDGMTGGTGGSGSGTDSTVLGHGARASGSDSLAMGVQAEASGDHSTASGAGATASGTNSTAHGGGARASGDNSLAAGGNAVASGANSTALGANGKATGNNAVALGANAVADRDDTVSIGSAGHERQIANVAAGTQRTDAANWGQVQDAVRGVQDWANRRIERIDGRIDRMGAMSAAYSQMAFSATGVNTPNRFGVGVGLQHGKSAVALGVSHQFSPNVNVSFGGSSSGKEASVGAGMAIGW